MEKIDFNGGIIFLRRFCGVIILFSGDFAFMYDFK